MKRILFLLLIWTSAAFGQTETPGRIDFAPGGRIGLGTYLVFYDTLTDSLLNFNGNITDSVSGGPTWTLHGAATCSTSVFKYGTGSLYCYANADYITSGTEGSPLWTLGTNDFSIESWIYFDELNATQAKAVWGQIDGSKHFQFFVRENFIKLYYYNWPDSIEPSASVSLAAGSWHHIAVSRESTSFRLFFDGNMVGAATSTANIPYFNVPWKMGYTSAINHRGYIDDFRFINGYAYRTADFTPPARQAALDLECRSEAAKCVLK